MSDNGINRSQQKLIDDFAKSMRSLNEEVEDSNDSFKSHSESLTDFEQRARKARSSVASLEAGQKSYEKRIEEGTNSISEQTKALEKLSESYSDGSISVEKYEKKKKRLNQSLGDQKKNLKELLALQKEDSKSLEGAKKRISNYTLVLNKLATTSDKTAKISKDIWNTKSSETYATALQKIISLRLRDIRIQKEAGVITEKSAKKMAKEASSYAENLIDPSGKIAEHRDTFLKMGGKSASGANVSQEDVKAAKDKFRTSVSSEAGALKSNLGGFLKGDQASAKALGEQMSSFEAASKGMVAAGKSATVLGGSIKLLGMAFSTLSKLTIVTAIIGAVAGLVSLIGKLDEFIKAANKSYFSLAGPITGLAGITEKMREFQNTVYGIDIKMKYGLDSEEVTEVFQSMQGEGMDLNGVEKRIGSYDKALESSAILSRTFGVSLGDMGGMVADQMLNLRSSLDGVSDSFSKMAFDASLAGVASKQFYQQIQNATAGLSFYGNYLSSTSGLLANFIDEGILGFKNASDHLTNLIQGMGNMSSDTMRTVYSILGPDAAKAMAEENLVSVTKMYDDAAQKLASAKVTVGQTMEGSKERSAAEAEVAALERTVKTLRGDKVLAKQQYESEDIIDQMSAVKRVSIEDPQKLIFAVLDRFQTGITDTTGIASTQISTVLEKLNISFKDYEMLRARGVEIGGAFEGSDKGKSLYEASKVTEGAGKKALDKLDELFANGALSKEDLTAQSGSIITSLGGVSGQEGLSETLKGLQSQNVNYLKAFVQNVKKGGFTSAGKMIEKLTRTTMSMTGSEESMDGGEASKIAQKVSGLQTPISKYLGIGKEAIEYAAASSDTQTLIAASTAQVVKNTGGILQATLDLVSKGNEKSMKALENKGLLGNLVSDKERLNIAGKTIGAIRQEELRIQAIPENERSLLDARTLSYIPDMIASQEKFIEKIKSKEGYGDIGSQLDAIVQKGTESAAEDKSNKAWLGIRKDYITTTKASVDELKKRNPNLEVTEMPAYSKMVSNSKVTSDMLANGSEKLEGTLTSILDSKASRTDRAQKLQSLDSGVDDVTANWLLSNKSRLNNYLGALYKGSGGESFGAAMASKETVTLVVQTPKGTIAEIAGRTASQQQYQASTNSEAKK